MVASLVDFGNEHVVTMVLRRPWGSAEFRWPENGSHVVCLVSTFPVGFSRVWAWRIGAY